MSSRTSSPSPTRPAPNPRARPRRALSVSGYLLERRRSQSSARQELAHAQAHRRRRGPDVICVQEHKLQDVHVNDAVRRLGEILPEYRTVKFAVSTAKKGYSGVAILAGAPIASAPSDRHREASPTSRPRLGREPSSASSRKRRRRRWRLTSKRQPAPRKRTQPPPRARPPRSRGRAAKCRGGHGGDFRSGYTDEGRVLTLEFDAFTMVFTYVPNSGQKLERLEYRLNAWDVDFRAYLAHLDGETRGKPVIVVATSASGTSTNITTSTRRTRRSSAA